MESLKGSFRAVILYDVADEIRLDEARASLRNFIPERRPDFRGPMPDYLGPEHPPVTCQLEDVILDAGDRWFCTVKFYDHGVVSVALERALDLNWDGLLAWSSRWVGAPDIERATQKIARAQVSQIQRALHRPYKDWTVEDYNIIHVQSKQHPDGHTITASELIAQHGSEIARIVRGESQVLSERETNEVLRDPMSYYATDLLVVAWTAAFVYDTPEGAAPILQLLEYTNAQLVEFRHYDTLMTRLLNTVYDELERRRVPWLRWRYGRDAERLNRMRLEVIELTERLDNSIKFLSDMFYARVYRIAAQRIGVTDYRALVDQKLKTADELYRHMQGEFHQARTFVLEFLVVAILIIELALLLIGKP